MRKSTGKIILQESVTSTYRYGQWSNIKVYHYFDDFERDDDILKLKKRFKEKLYNLFIF